MKEKLESTYVLTNIEKSNSPTIMSTGILNGVLGGYLPTYLLGIQAMSQVTIARLHDEG